MKNGRHFAIIKETSIVSEQSYFTDYGIGNIHKKAPGECFPDVEIGDLKIQFAGVLKRCTNHARKQRPLSLDVGMSTSVHVCEMRVCACAGDATRVSA